MCSVYNNTYTKNPWRSRCAHKQQIPMFLCNVHTRLLMCSKYVGGTFSLHVCNKCVLFKLWLVCTVLYSIKNDSTVLPQLSDPLGAKTCSDNQKVWIIKQMYMKQIKTVTLNSQAISLLEYLLSRHSQIAILCLVVILAI